MTSVETRPTLPAGRRPVTAVQVALLITLLVRATGFVYPFLAYRVAELGYAPSVAGDVVAVFGVGWLLGQPVMGWAADRYGPRCALAVVMVFGGVVLPALAAAHSLLWLAAGAVAAGVVFDAPRPVASLVIVTEVAADADRVRANSWRHWGTNLGAAVTGVVGGFLAGRIGLPALWRIEGAGCAVMAVASLWLPGRSPVRSGAGWVNLRLAVGDRTLWWLSAASLGGLIPVMSAFAALPLLMTVDHLSAFDFGIVQAANAVTVLTLTPVIGARLARSARFRPLTAALAGSCVLLGAALGGTGLVHTTLGYTIVVIAYTPAEIALFVSAGDVLARIAPPHRQGAYAGLWGTTLAAAGVLAPLLASWALSTGGPHLVGAVIGGTGLLGAGLCYPLARRLPRRGKHRKSPGAPPDRVNGPLIADSPLACCEAS